MPKIPSLWREFASIALRRQRPGTRIAASYPAGERYSVANGPVSSILVPLVIIGLLGDIPLCIVIVAVWHPAHAMLIRIAFALLGLSGLGWAIAVRSVLRSMPHVVSHEALWIGGGIRICGVIPKAAIERVLPIGGSRRDWMSEHQLTRNEVIVASGFDPPNLAMEIRQTAWETVRIVPGQKQEQYCRWILLYADNPAALAAIANSSGGI